MPSVTGPGAVATIALWLSASNSPSTQPSEIFHPSSSSSTSSKQSVSFRPSIISSTSDLPSVMPSESYQPSGGSSTSSEPSVSFRPSITSGSPITQPSKNFQPSIAPTSPNSKPSTGPITTSLSSPVGAPKAGFLQGSVSQGDWTFSEDEEAQFQFEDSSDEDGNIFQHKK
ncbi:expressed unknown protein [Seminavis robusta]|uniref:Uncharacterized protein n=1 Tax=Seminavis robusta TaxID=568900 RepID=A0A9N8EVG7_9STRA|nr:expressed unknown protein [Seminavis robusta]|eukprot:Sro1944_g306890.1 n/a (171) ;mRNA; r:2940-3452